MSRKAWRGTVEAAAIQGVCRPALLHRIEWQADGPEPVPVSAEILTLVTDPVAQGAVPADGPGPVSGLVR